jgi:hypothetical protein
MTTKQKNDTMAIAMQLPTHNNVSIDGRGVFYESTLRLYHLIHHAEVVQFVQFSAVSGASWLVSE